MVTLSPQKKPGWVFCEMFLQDVPESEGIESMMREEESGVLELKPPGELLVLTYQRRLTRNSMGKSYYSSRGRTRYCQLALFLG